MSNLSDTSFPHGNQVISARQLPKPGGAQKGEIIDPYVMLQMHGVPADCKKAKSTKHVDDNGFNPVWNETSIFEVRRENENKLFFLVLLRKKLKRKSRKGELSISLRPRRLRLSWFAPSHVSPVVLCTAMLCVSSVPRVVIRPVGAPMKSSRSLCPFSHG